MEDQNYITISDDDDVEILDHIITLEPIVIDLTGISKRQQLSESEHPIENHSHSQSQAEPQPYSQAEPQFYFQAGSQPYPQAGSQPYPQAEPQPYPQAEPQPYSQAEPQPYFQAEPQPYLQAEAQPYPQAEPQPCPQAEPQPCPQVEPQPCPQAEPQPYSQAEPQPYSQAEPQAYFQAEPQPYPQAEPQPYPQAEPQPCPQAKPQPCPQTKPQLHPQAEPQPCPQHKSRPKNKLVKKCLSDRELMISKKEMGNTKFREKAMNEAIRLYREASTLADRLGDKQMSAILHFNLAMSYDKLGSYNQAADECAAAVKIDDKYIKAHVKRAEIYMHQGKYEEAVICYEHICEIDKEHCDEAARRIIVAKEFAKTVRKRDQYEILGLQPHFTTDELKQAFKQKARAHHPDKHSDADIVTRRIQEKIFKEASEANAYFRKRFGYN